ncbi:MAG: transcription-repair coupling factor [Chthoniobacterales bacterium]|nr:transcription-repair coupling factor [Chthoniobacterales bacterium]
MSHSLLSAGDASPAARRWLEAVQSGRPTAAGGTAPSAQPFLAAWLAERLAQPVCIVCPDVKRQEEFFHDLKFWNDRVLFVPELELGTANGAQDPELAAARLGALRELDTGKIPLVVATAAGLQCPAPSARGLQEDTRLLTRGAPLAPSDLVAELDRGGFVRVSAAAERGQYAVRGGILDVFPWQTPLPVRLEFFGDELESLRSYDPDTQRSIETLANCELCLGSAATQADATVRDHLPDGILFLSIEEAWPEAGARIHSDAVLADEEDIEIAAGSHPAGDFAAGDIVLLEQRRRDLFRQIGGWQREGWNVQIVCTNEGEAARLRELAAGEAEAPRDLPIMIGALARGFTLPDAKLVLLTDAEIFGRAASMEARRGGWQRARAALVRQSLRFDDFAEDELVVHLEYGIARFRGLQVLAGQEQAGEVLTLEFARGSKLYVPLDQGWKVSRYVGVGRKNPALSELGDGRWQRARTRAEKSVLAYAEQMLRVQAEREAEPGLACGPDNAWQGEFEESFPFDETPDQLRAIADTKQDMESSRPMDRLICGDVGFGKTEVAIRAAFKSVMGGRQVAFLAPTTVLAQQHWQTLRERVSDYPVTVGLLSRFRTPKEQRKTLAGMRDGSVDIVVGTHRLLGKDVGFKNLGLVVVDEEQRFGVLHKERLKENFRRVDVLTLSATPIPRTLYLSLLGARDMSTIETPPPNRVPIETVICGYDERIVRDAIRRELARGGQVYFLHNRVQSIERVAERLAVLVPDARVLVGHGQMPEERLEDVMAKFVRGDADILLCTTIIESGLDIPNANTIIIDRADRFGLADLYQLRGRVGRSNHKAYAYLLLPRDLMGGGEARQRIAAIRQYSNLGAGFRVAMRDLEIRGAGNILGTEQSGHILAIGFEFYCRLLKIAVAKLKGERTPGRPDIRVEIDFMATDPAAAGEGQLPAWIPADYIAEPRERIAAHRELAEAENLPGLEQVKTRWRDRYGRLPAPARNLLKLAAVRLRAAAAGVDLVAAEGEVLRLRKNGDFIMVGHRHPRLEAGDPALKLRQILSLLQQL